MSTALLVVCDSEEMQVRLEIILVFLGQPVVFTRDAQSSLEAIGKQDILFAILGLNEDAERKTLHELALTYPNLGLYVLRNQTEQEKFEVPENATACVKFPIAFKGLSRLISQAQRRYNLSQNSKSRKMLLDGDSPAIRRVDNLCRHVAQTNSNVLITGESGTGKEVVAKSIHNVSARADHPFIAVNCGAIPPDILESELFGHEKGSFTGAISSRKGRFELAEGGTLFLDEIGDMPLPMQVKLLRVIQERAYERVGGTKTMSSDVRLIAATHQNLEDQIGEGKFRTDLFFRLNVFPIELPPLRERKTDIPCLITIFAKKMTKELDLSEPLRFEQSAIDAICQYDLPGNVRELRNLVERLSILHHGETISPSMLPQRYQAGLKPAAALKQEHPTPSPAFSINMATLSEGAFDMKQHLVMIERDLINQALDSSDGVVSKAAKLLSLQRTTLIQKMRKYEIKSNQHN